MYTRNDYMDKLCTHREYYGQFVTPSMKEHVKRLFESQIIASVDKHFNDISLKSIDPVGNGYARHIAWVSNELNGSTSNCIAFRVCVIKEAMSQIKEEYIRGEG